MNKVPGSKPGLKERVSTRARIQDLRSKILPLNRSRIEKLQIFVSQQVQLQGFRIPGSSGTFALRKLGTLESPRIWNSGNVESDAGGFRWGRRLLCVWTHVQNRQEMHVFCVYIQLYTNRKTDT